MVGGMSSCRSSIHTHTQTNVAKMRNNMHGAAVCVPSSKEFERVYLHAYKRWGNVYRFRTEISAALSARESASESREHHHESRDMCGEKMGGIT